MSIAKTPAQKLLKRQRDARYRERQRLSRVTHVSHLSYEARIALRQKKGLILKKCTAPMCERIIRGARVGLRDFCGECARSRRDWFRKTRRRREDIADGLLGEHVGRVAGEMIARLRAPT